MVKQFAIISLTVASYILPAKAVVLITPDSQTNGTNSLPHTYVPSTSDLIAGLAPSAVGTGNFGEEASGNTPVLTDGAFPSPITRPDSGPFQFGAFATGGNGGGTSVTYTLNLASDISMINVFGGWQDGGRDEQSYDVFYSTALAPATFILLASVDFNPADPGSFPQVTRVTISDTSGPLATNVAALRFDFTNTENGYSGYSEIDVIAVPEASTAALLGFMMVGVAARRRRS